MKIVALAGGVGGAKLADGLAQVLPAGDLTVIVNTGDDFQFLGLSICPDVDTVCYTLAGLANPDTGWGRKEETFKALENIRRLGGPSWFNIGDQDLGIHLERTRRLAEGQFLSEIMADFCRAWGIKTRVLPMSDQPVQTIVETAEAGDLAFQEYFVHRKCEPRVTGFRFEGIEQAQPAPGVLEAIASARAVIFCPSNPWVSIDPILSVMGIRKGIDEASIPVIAVSPIIGGETVKGPAAKMSRELGIEPSALAVAQHYGGLLSGFVLDKVDERLLSEMPVSAWAMDTIMKTREDRRRLAEDVLHLIESNKVSRG
jgi:LPPG:FO 2-phospho-L-lactate transferase